MDCSSSLFLLSLGLQFVLCEKCPEALHEALKKGFDATQKCDDCVTLSPGIPFEGGYWTGFCSGNRLHVFRDWECGKPLNATESFAVVTNASCELAEGSRDLDEKCLNVFSGDMCYRPSDVENKGRKADLLGYNESIKGVEIRDLSEKTSSSTSTTTTTYRTTPTTEHVNLERKNCEANEYYFQDHCYFIKSFYTEESWPLNATAVCQERHPKALGLAVETMEENKYIMDLLKNANVPQPRIFTSGVGVIGLPGKWSGWNLTINNSVLELQYNDFPVKKWMPTVYYYIDTSKMAWSIHVCTKPKLNESPLSYVICERVYNPANVQVGLHERCLQEYRKSTCYNATKHANFCCGKDETGDLWFACPLENRLRTYSQEYYCEWFCGNRGFFTQIRPICKGMYNCDDSYNGVRYRAPFDREAVARCPAHYWGNATWQCVANKTFRGTPDFSFCCESATRGYEPCVNTDMFLNVWMGCPSKTVIKKTACPPGMILSEALVTWLCQYNGHFYGKTPDYSNCNVSKSIKCKGTDRFDNEWQAEAGTTAKKDCPPRHTGLCYWHCTKSGVFDGPQPDCSKCRADWMNEVTDKIKNQTDHKKVMEIMENYTKSEDITIGYSHVLNLTAECVSLFKQQVTESNITAFKTFLESYSKILKNVAGNPNTWANFSVHNRRNYSENILHTTQTAAFANLKIGNESLGKYNETFAVSQDDGFDFFVAYNPSVGSRFPLENFSTSDWHLDIKQISERNHGFAAMGLVMGYSLSTLMFPQGNETEHLEMNAPAVTFTVATSRGDRIMVDPNVVVSVSFKHRYRTRMPETLVIRRRLHVGEKPSGVFKSTLCFYYRDSDWTTDGCYVTFTSKDRTNCTCHHLSTIGLLMSIHKYEPNTVLEVVSTVSSGITIISLILALLVFYYFDTAGNDRLLIGKNLCFCLIVGHAMLITVLDKKFFNIPDNACMVFAILIHYVFMAAFAWMFVEGCHLYRMLILVFDSGMEYRVIYMVIGYGMPFVVVGVTHFVGFVLQEQPYGQDEVCWLKPPIYVWAFVGPVIVLTSINFFILILSMKIAIESKRKKEKTDIVTVMLWMKRWVSLSALLGITWLFGFAYFNYNEPLMYVFVLFNGLQGFFIFLFRCALCEQYKTALMKKLKCWFWNSKLKSHKKTENVKSETKLYAISGSKSLTESRDSGYDPGIEERNEFEKSSGSETKTKNQPIENSSGVDVTLTPAMSEAFLRNRMIERNFSVRKSKAKLLDESVNFPELSYHYIHHPNN